MKYSSGEIRNQIKRNLAAVDSGVWKNIIQNCEYSLENSLKTSDEKESNRLWFLLKVSIIKRNYLLQFEKVKDEAYYEAWCLLERIETDLTWLFKNKFYAPEKYGMHILRQLVRKWQELFPYKLFLSPAYRKKRVECNVCGQSRDPWSRCNHKLGRVYGGRECYGIVTECELIEISVVTDPVQKYSVLREIGDENGNSVDRHNYSLLSFLVERICSPYSWWEMRWTKAYHPHSLFEHYPIENFCPCGSNLLYANCCKGAPGVIRPHAEFIFEQEPPSDLPRALLSGYKS